MLFSTKLSLNINVILAIEERNGKFFILKALQTIYCASEVSIFTDLANFYETFWSDLCMCVWWRGNSLVMFSVSSMEIHLLKFSIINWLVW